MDELTSQRQRQQRHRVYVAGLLASFAVLFLSLIPWIETTGLAGREDPGPSFFPVLLCVFLLGCAGIELLQFVLSRVASRNNDSPANDSPANDSPANDSPANDSPANDSPANESPANESSGTAGVAEPPQAVAWRAVLGVAALILVYIIALPLLGFSVSSFLFATVLLLAYRTSWWSALLIALAFVVGIRLLFIRLFEIYLPEGWLTEFWS